MPKLDEYVQVAEAAEYLGVHHNTLRNWGRAGKIPEYRHPVNNYRLFKVRDLDKLLKNTEQSVAKKFLKPR
jgi:excisionase family DNA binding protein